MTISYDEVAALTAELVAIDSTNPDLVPGGAGEVEIARFVAGWLESAGLDVELRELGPRRANVMAIARGSGGGRTLMLNAHMDVVGAGDMGEPWTPRMDGTRLYGRGAYDMKASLAAIMLAGRDAAKRDLRGDVMITAVADEEYASIGVQDVVRHMAADAAIVAEPTGLDLCVAHKGFVWLEVETRGVASHGSLPAEGVDAIAKMGPVLTGLADLDRELRSRPGHPLLGPSSIHASLIRGGQELSTYPARCVLSIERRTIPGETIAEVEGQIAAILAAAGAADSSFQAELRTLLVREPFSVGLDQPIVDLARRHLAQVTGRDPEIVGAGGWMDSAFLAAAGIPTVIVGPDGEGAHADVEWVDLMSATRTADTLLGIIGEFCA
ncbi:MAG: ArgE/DapE family deacylase [Thermomicrobiales bacterium]|nr:ArgE/DapE family deacylase [Thermomicrobiales bacterium]MDF3015394.1 ArgE/DapE family deacylase [Thermomicrobiales bacterium]